MILDAGFCSLGGRRQSIEAVSEEEDAMDGSHVFLKSAEHCRDSLAFR